MPVTAPNQVHLIKPAQAFLEMKRKDAMKNRAAQLRARADALESGGFSQLGMWIPTMLKENLSYEAKSEDITLTELVTHALKAYLKILRRSKPPEHKRPGLTLVEYRTLLKRQGGKCAICGNINENGRRLAVDHDHKTRNVRGLLCHNCNSALGFAKDSPKILDKMIHYLMETPKKILP